MNEADRSLNSCGGEGGGGLRGGGGGKGAWRTLLGWGVGDKSAECL